MNGDLTAVHDWSKLSEQDQQTMANNWHKETDKETLQKSGYSIQNRACYEYYRRRAMQNTNICLYKEIDFLQINLKLYQKSQQVHSSNYDKTIETITSLITKQNGHPLNNEMAQVLQILQNSKKQIGLECKQIVTEYKNELIKHGKQDDSVNWLTFDLPSDQNKK